MFLALVMTVGNTMSTKVLHWTSLFIPYGSIDLFSGDSHIPPLYRVLSLVCFGNVQMLLHKFKEDLGDSVCLW